MIRIGWQQGFKHVNRICLSRTENYTSFIHSLSLFFVNFLFYLFFFSGPMCKIMVRFPNGSRTHMSLSAEASLKVRS